MDTSSAGSNERYGFTSAQPPPSRPTAARTLKIVIMFRAILALGLVGLSAAFRAPMRSRAPVKMMARPGMSESVPFLPKSPALDGTMAGDVEFDPVGFTKITDFDWSTIVVPKWFNEDREGLSTLYWMREAELKHGRTCMLAVLGWLAVDAGFHFPYPEYAGLSSLAAHDVMVKSGNMGFLLTVIFVLELLSGAAIYDAAKGSGRAPGDYSFDPLGLGKGTGKAFPYF